MKITFYLVRHGETLFNQLGRMQGSCDSPLTERGIAQAYETADQLKEIWFDHIYTSPSERAWNTANIIGSTSSTIRIARDEFWKIGRG